MSQLSEFLQHLQTQPESISFAQTIDTITQHYDYTPTRFSNGVNNPVVSEAGSNEGSCKIFAFAKIHQLNEAQTLQLFGDFYRKDVLEHPDANDHANIRTFMRDGWAGIQFDREALKPKS